MLHWISYEAGIFPICTEVATADLYETLDKKQAPMRARPLALTSNFRVNWSPSLKGVGLRLLLQRRPGTPWAIFPFIHWFWLLIPCPVQIVILTMLS